MSCKHWENVVMGRASGATRRMRWLLLVLPVLAMVWPSCAIVDTCDVCGSRPLAPSHVEQPQLVGGVDALPGSWPWMVSLQLPTITGHNHTCGGSLITARWILTAAHCFRNKRNLPHWRAVVGATKLSSLGPEVHVRFVKQVVIHEDYKPTTEVNDIALMELDQPVKCSDYIQPACMPDSTVRVPTLTYCYIGGWGVLREGATKRLDVMQEAKVDRFPVEQCNSTSWYNGDIREHNLCAGYEKAGIDSCQGDSGGPLMCTEEASQPFWVIGVTSWSRGCGKARRPGVYTATQPFYSWVKGWAGPMPQSLPAPQTTTSAATVPVPTLTSSEPLESTGLPATSRSKPATGGEPAHTIPSMPEPKHTPVPKMEPEPHISPETKAPPPPETHPPPPPPPPETPAPPHTHLSLKPQPPPSPPLETPAPFPPEAPSSPPPHSRPRPETETPPPKPPPSHQPHATPQSPPETTPRMKPEVPPQPETEAPPQTKPHSKPEAATVFPESKGSSQTPPGPSLPPETEASPQTRPKAPPWPETEVPPQTSSQATTRRESQTPPRPQPETPSQPKAEAPLQSKPTSMPESSPRPEPTAPVSGAPTPHQPEPSPPPETTAPAAPAPPMPETRPELSATQPEAAGPQAPNQSEPHGEANGTVATFFKLLQNFLRHTRKEKGDVWPKLTEVELIEEVNVAPFEESSQPPATELPVETLTSPCKQTETARVTTVRKCLTDVEAS